MAYFFEIKTDIVMYNFLSSTIDMCRVIPFLEPPKQRAAALWPSWCHCTGGSLVNMFQCWKLSIMSKNSDDVYIMYTIAIIQRKLS